MDFLLFALKLELFLVLGYAFIKLIQQRQSDINKIEIETKISSQLLKKFSTHPSTKDLMKILFILNTLGLLNRQNILQALPELENHPNPRDIRQAIELSCHRMELTEEHLLLILKHSHPLILAQAFLKLKHFNALHRPSYQDLFLFSHSPLELMHALQVLAENQLLNALTLKACFEHPKSIEWAQGFIELNQLKFIRYLAPKTILKHPHLLQLSTLLRYLSRHNLLCETSLKLVADFPYPLRFIPILERLKSKAYFNRHLTLSILEFENPKLLNHTLQSLDTHKLLSLKNLNSCLHSSFSLELMQAVNLCNAHQCLNQMSFDILVTRGFSKSFKQILSALLGLEGLTQEHLNHILHYFDPFHLAEAINIISPYLILNLTTLVKLLNSRSVPDMVFSFQFLSKIKALSPDVCEQIVWHPCPDILALTLSHFIGKKFFNTHMLELILTHNQLKALDSILTTLEEFNLFYPEPIHFIISQAKIEPLNRCQKILKLEHLLTPTLMETLIFYPDHLFLASSLVSLKLAKLLKPQNILAILQHNQNNQLKHSFSQFFSPFTQTEVLSQTSLNLILNHHPFILNETSSQLVKLTSSQRQILLKICAEKDGEPGEKARRMKNLFPLTQVKIYLKGLENIDLQNLLNFYSVKALSQLMAEDLGVAPRKPMTLIYGFQGFKNLIASKVYEEYLEKYRISLDFSQTRVIFEIIKFLLGRQLTPQYLSTMRQNWLSQSSLYLQKQEHRFFKAPQEHRGKILSLCPR